MSWHREKSIRTPKSSGINNFPHQIIFMKSINQFLILIVSVFLVISLPTGCLKDDDFDEGKTNITVNTSDQILEIRGPIIGSIGQVLEFSTVDTTVNLVTVNLAAIAPAQEDIKVTFALDSAVIEEYNSGEGASFTPLPASNFSFPTLEVTIPKGSHEAVLSGVIKNPSFLQTGTYALGIRVVSVSNSNIKISGNYGKQVIALRVKNLYHGLYKAIGVFHHPTAGDRDIDQDKELITQEPNSVIAWLGDLGPDYQMILVINADNTVTIQPWGATPNVDQSWGPNYYDPATQSFHLHYSYNTAAPRIVEEVITRK